ncbi:hypothetical protein LINGRAPRIM_LOCUS1603 [Linum grandiflorum]
MHICSLRILKQWFRLNCQFNHRLKHILSCRHYPKLNLNHNHNHKCKSQLLFNPRIKHRPNYSSKLNPLIISFSFKHSLTLLHMVICIHNFSFRPMVKPYQFSLSRLYVSNYLHSHRTQRPKFIQWHIHNLNMSLRFSLPPKYMHNCMSITISNQFNRTLLLSLANLEVLLIKLWLGISLIYNHSLTTPCCLSICILKVYLYNSPSILSNCRAHPTGLAVQQRPAPQPVQQPMHQQYVQNQQHFSGQPFGQNHKHQQTHHMQQNMHSHSQLRPQAFPHQDSSSLYGGHTQHSRDLAGRPVVPPDGVQDNPHRLQSGPSLRAMSVKKSDSLAEEGVGADVSSQGTAAAKADSTIKPDFDLKSTNGETKSTGETKDGLGSQSAINVDPTMQRLQEKLEEGDGGKKDVSDAVNKQDDSSVSVENEMLKTSLSKDEEQLSKSHDGDLVSQSTAFVHDKVTVYNKDGLSSLLHRPPTGQTSLQGPPGSSVGNSAQHRPPGPANIPQVGQPLNLICAGYNGSHGSEILPGGLQGPKSALAFSAGLSYYGSSQGPHTQGNSALSKGEIATFSGREGEMFPPLRPNPSINSNATGMNMVPGHLFDSSSMLGLPNERFGPFAGGHLHAFSQDAARRAAGRGQLEEDIKGFSRASDLEASLALKFRGPHGFRGDMIPRAPEDGPYRLTYDSGSNMDTVASHAPSRHFPPYNYEPASHCSDVGEGPIGFHGKPFGGLDLARSHKDLLGPGAGYAQRLVDSFGSRSPGRDYLSLRKFGPFPSLDDVHGRDNKTFDGSSGRSFHDPRFPVMPSHSRRDEFHGLGSSRISDNYRFSEFIGQDGMPNHLRGENFGPHKLSGHLRFTELAGLGPVHGHHSVREYPVNGNFHTARFGEPGFRSSFTLNGFPGGERNYAGELDSFGKSIKRKPSSTGWCRICKVDCETVEGLEVHSQTKEHQNMALDMVVTIKQNAKKQKLIQSNNPSVDDSSNLRNIVSEGRGD